MSAIAIIPARGGSKGIPRKNIKELGGLPLIVRTIWAALKAHNIDAVYVSSDDDEIVAIARDSGANTIVRPPKLATGEASSESVLLHALKTIENQNGKTPEVIVFLQCTSPFTSAHDIDRVVDTMNNADADSAFSAKEDHGLMWRIDEGGHAEGITHDQTKPRQRRQDMEVQYRETGAIYAMRTSAFVASGQRFCGRVIAVPLVTPALEIDTPEDWEIAEALCPLFRENEDDRSRLKTIRTIVTDFDGVHTDDKVSVDENGKETVVCHRRDGMGIELLQQAGYRTLILSKEKNPVVAQRAKKLKMEIIQGVDNKVDVLGKWLKDNELEWFQIAYVGNDINDLECLRQAGIGFVPADADNRAKLTADILLGARGGEGALREVADLFLKAE